MKATVLYKSGPPLQDVKTDGHWLVLDCTARGKGMIYLSAANVQSIAVTGQQ